LAQTQTKTHAPRTEVPQYSAEYFAWATRRMDIVMARLAIALRDLRVSVQELRALAHLGSGEDLGPSDHVTRGSHPSDRQPVVITRTAKADKSVAPGSSPLATEIFDLAETLSDLPGQDARAFRPHHALTTKETIS
jgi:hypothetical protein